MTAAGLAVMLVSIVGITALFAWCIIRVIKAPVGDSEMHGFEVETPDKDT